MNKAKQRKLAADLKGFNVESILTAYEKLAGKMLREKKYPATLKKLWTRDNLPEDIGLLKNVLSRASNVRDRVQKNEAESAALNALQLCFYAWAAQVPLILPDIRRGKKTLKAASTGGRERAINRAEECETKYQNWQGWADEVWERRPGWSKSQVAAEIKTRHKIEEKAGTIRKKI